MLYNKVHLFRSIRGEKDLCGSCMMYDEMHHRVVKAGSEILKEMMSRCKAQRADSSSLLVISSPSMSDQGALSITPQDTKRVSQKRRMRDCRMMQRNAAGVGELGTAAKGDAEEAHSYASNPEPNERDSLALIT